MEALLLQDQKNIETVMYANSGAVSKGEVITVAGIGALVAATDIGSATTGTYYTRGNFRFTLASGENPSQGQRVYWDVSADKAIAFQSASLATGDIYLGRAVANASASGGYVDVELNTAGSPEIVDNRVAVKNVASATLKAALTGSAVNLFSMAKGDTILEVIVSCSAGHGTTATADVGSDNLIHSGADADGFVKTANVNAAGLYTSMDGTYTGALAVAGAHVCAASGYITITSAGNYTGGSFAGMARVVYIPAKS